MPRFLSALVVPAVRQRQTMSSFWPATLDRAIPCSALSWSARPCVLPVPTPGQTEHCPAHWPNSTIWSARASSVRGHFIPFWTGQTSDASRRTGLNARGACPTPLAVSSSWCATRSIPSIPIGIFALPTPIRSQLWTRSTSGTPISSGHWQLVK